MSETERTLTVWCSSCFPGRPCFACETPNPPPAGLAFTLGDPRFPTCCAKPVGCTNADAEECPFWNHLWKRQDNPDHPNHIRGGERGCPSRLLLRWGSAACDNQAPGHEQHSQAASGLTWTDADAERSVEDRGLV